MRSLIIGLAAILAAHAAAASPCGDKIEKLQAMAGASPAANTATTAGAGAETADAKLHHQPTAATAGDATGAADSETALRDARFRNDLFNAQAANDSGDARGCEAAVEAAEKEAPR